MIFTTLIVHTVTVSSYYTVYFQMLTDEKVDLTSLQHLHLSPCYAHNKQNYT